MSDCNHKRLYFGSGDYYLFCKECHRNWAVMGDGPEYVEINGKWHGANPDFCAPDFRDDTADRVSGDEIERLKAENADYRRFIEGVSDTVFGGEHGWEHTGLDQLLQTLRKVLSERNSLQGVDTFEAPTSGGGEVLPDTKESEG